jgi:hypothetical protein
LPPDALQGVVIVWGLRRGREVWSGSAYKDSFVDDLEVTRRGAVAWLDDAQVVTKCDRNGRAEIGDRASNLRRIGRAVFWRTAGERHTYRYRGHNIASPWTDTGTGRATTRPGPAVA